MNSAAMKILWWAAVLIWFECTLKSGNAGSKKWLYDLHPYQQSMRISVDTSLTILGIFCFFFSVSFEPFWWAYSQPSDFEQIEFDVSRRISSLWVSPSLSILTVLHEATSNIYATCHVPKGIWVWNPWHVLCHQNLKRNIFPFYWKYRNCITDPKTQTARKWQSHVPPTAGFCSYMPFPSVVISWRQGRW